MPFRAISPEKLEWITRPHDKGEPARHVEVPRGGLIHVDAGTALQTVNHGAEDLLVYAYGYPPEDEHAELLDPAV